MVRVLGASRDGKFAIPMQHADASHHRGVQRASPPTSPPQWHPQGLKDRISLFAAAERTPPLPLLPVEPQQWLSPPLPVEPQRWLPPLPVEPQVVLCLPPLPPEEPRQKSAVEAWVQPPLPPTPPPAAVQATSEATVEATEDLYLSDHPPLPPLPEVPIEGDSCQLLLPILHETRTWNWVVLPGDAHGFEAHFSSPVVPASSSSQDHGARTMYIHI